jgi:peroxiredoxin
MDSAKRNRLIVTLLILLVMGGITFYLVRDQIQPKNETRVDVPVVNNPQKQQQHTRVAEPIPQLDLRLLDGSPLKLADYAGKTILINIWSANYAQSIEEMRQLRPIYDKFLTDSRVVMIGLSSEQDIDALKQFAAENSINWIQGTATATASAATKEFLAHPELLIVGKDGSIIERPGDWWEAFILLSEIVPQRKPAQVEGITVDFEQLPNQPTDNPQALGFTRIPPPSADDAASGAKVSVVDGRLHGLSGPPTILNDGKLPSTNDSPPENFFFIAKTIEGRFEFDLGKSISIKAINSYTWHAHERSPQVFRLYGADGSAANFVAGPKFGVDLLCLEIEAEQRLGVALADVEPPVAASRW